MEIVESDITGKEGRDTYKDTDVIAHVRRKRMRWACHVLQREERSLLENMGSGKLERTRQLGRPKCKGWDYVISDTTYMEISVEVAVDRKR